MFKPVFNNSRFSHLRSSCCGCDIWGTFSSPLERRRIWSIRGGVLAFSNYLLIYSMQELEASVSATIYRLNLVLVAFMAIVFLGEDINKEKVIGLCLACLSLFLFATHHQKIISKKTSYYLLVVIIASILRALMGICFKVAITIDIQPLWFLASQGVSWMVFGVIMGLKSKHQWSFALKDMSNGGLSGLMICGVIYFLARALEQGQASIIIPVSQMSFIITAILSCVWLNEKPSLRKTVGLILACLSILVLAQSN